MNSNTNWGVVIIDLAIIGMAIGISVWQDNPHFLWLLLILLTTGSEVK